MKKRAPIPQNLLKNSRTFRGHHGLSGPRLFTRTDNNKSPYVCDMVHKRSIMTYVPYRDIIKPTLCEGFALYSGLDGISLKSSTGLFLVQGDPLTESRALEWRAPHVCGQL